MQLPPSVRLLSEKHIGIAVSRAMTFPAQWARPLFSCLTGRMGVTWTQKLQGGTSRDKESWWRGGSLFQFSKNEQSLVPQHSCGGLGTV